MRVFGTVLFFLALAVSSNGHHHSPCHDLSGTWRNQLGSNMTIQEIDGSTHRITGQYSTSVESSRGASIISSKIAGLVQPVEHGSLVAFNVLWNNGASITAWVGQCMECDGQAKIHTTWVLRSLLLAPKKRWMSTRINQDTFWKVEGQAAEQVSSGGSTGNSDLVGSWTSVSGDSFDINNALDQGGFEGEHAPIPEDKGAVFGRYAGNETYTALGFAAAHQNQIRGWTGHIYPQQPSVIETSWLSQTYSDNCNNPRKFVQYGMDNYRKSTADAA